MSATSNRGQSYSPALNKSKANNARDILIAEVAIANEYTLLTSDRDLATVAEKHGGKVVYYKT